jgi:hypothetical protein
LRNGRARRLPLRAMAHYNKPRINAAAKSSGLRRRLDARRVDLDAPSRHLAVAAIDRVDAGIVTSCVRPIIGIWDQPEALGREEEFSLGEEGELQTGGHGLLACLIMPTSASSLGLDDRRCYLRRRSIFPTHRDTFQISRS